MSVVDQLCLIKVTPVPEANGFTKVVCAAINLVGLLAGVFLIGVAFGYGFHLGTP